MICKNCRTRNDCCGLYNDYNRCSDYERENNMSKSMGHFIDWKFGVPVKVYGHTIGFQPSGRLVFENETLFRTQNEDSAGGQIFLKKDYYYELIPYSCDCQLDDVRYPVCENSRDISYCNTLNEMQEFCSEPSDSISRIPDCTATLIIDGKEIELSQETVARLKKDLGV